ncbi:MAG: hypothetical protein A3G75_13530 [Verrucomicrobia bacterium RIFCSPLOWO2_12_FULL_64_8]|nr:MAG: hypothetical protein A3G75_13530 [Verrucomicrobia bacterium RIFCSPLOWO2_12_FULL_64_8]
MTDVATSRPSPGGKITPNSGHRLGEQTAALGAPAAWPVQHTAILVIHGIGNQQPLETLDPFAETLARTYRDAGCDVSSEQVLVPNPTDDKRTPWFQNVIRLKCRDQNSHVDLYEYYWAPETEDAATFEDIQAWLRGVVNQAESFYRDEFLKNAELGKMYRDKSLFFDVSEKNGVHTVRFRSLRYRLVISTTGFVIPLAGWLADKLNDALAAIPVIGGIVSWLYEAGTRSGLHALANVIGDITVYNTYNRRSKHWNIRQKILGGAVAMLRRLIEADDRTKTWPYGRVIVAGHSLGSEVAFDALNRLNLLCGEGCLAGFGRDGRILQGYQSPAPVVAKLDDLLCGLVTFGSPLDKVAFFMREEARDNEIYRRQIIENYRGFKQQRWSEQADIETWQRLAPPAPRLLDGIRWHNYHDGHDYVSGSLDYYLNLVNVNCAFAPPAWTKPVGVLAVALGAPWVVAIALVAAGLIVGGLALSAMVAYGVLWPGEASFTELLKIAWERLQVFANFAMRPAAWLAIWTTAVLGLGFGWLAGVFSHSKYWHCRGMYREIIERFLEPADPPRHP